MKVIRSDEAEMEEREGGIFIGKIGIARFLDSDLGSREFRSAIVTFPPGTRNKFHTHTHEQILFVTEGEGIVATEDEEAAVKVGDMVLIPAGESHWHGATKHDTFKHLYVTQQESKTNY